MMGNDRRWFRSHWANCCSSIKSSLKKDLPAFMMQMDWDKKWEFYGPKEVLEVLEPVKDQLEAVMLAWQTKTGKDRHAGRGFDEECVVRKAVLCKPSVPVAEMSSTEARTTVAAWVRALTPGTAMPKYGDEATRPVYWPVGIPWVSPSKPPKRYGDWLGAMRAILVAMLRHVGEDPQTFHTQESTTVAVPIRPPVPAPRTNQPVHPPTAPTDDSDDSDDLSFLNDQQDMPPLLTATPTADDHLPATPTVCMHSTARIPPSTTPTRTRSPPEVAALPKIPDTTRPEKRQPDPEKMGPSIQSFFSSPLKYEADSAEQTSKEEAIAQWIGRTGLPARSVEDEDFVKMMLTIDKRLTLPKKAKITNSVDKLYNTERQKFQDRLATARKLTIGLDIWTKKGLTASFLAISACYYCTQQNMSRHILLRLEQISHPHTAECIKTCVDRCTEDWGIPKEKILTVITDNGSNMVAAFKNEDADEPSSEDDEVQSSDEESEEGDEEQRYGAIKRTPCVVHTLQLVVNMTQKEQGVKRLLDKVRGLVRLFRKSSVATERLLQLCGLTLVKDCVTRWSSSYQMVSRLLEVKDSIVLVADGMDWDGLLPSEWQKLAALKDLLLPFAEHTKMLQSDTMSLSLVVPALLDLSAHLSQFPQDTGYRDLAGLAQNMKANMEQRFSCFLDPMDPKFSPLATAACFLDPTVSPETLIENEDRQIQELLRRAEDYISQTIIQQQQQEEEDDDDAYKEEEEIKEAAESAPPSKRPRFRFFSKARTSRPLRQKPSVRQEIQKFKEQLSQPIHEESAIDFWAAQGSTMYQTLKPFAFDLLTMPASQAFAERVFSITGDLTRGRRNRARLILERSAFLKLNRDG